MFFVHVAMQLEARKLDSKKMVADIIFREEAALRSGDVEVRHSFVVFRCICVPLKCPRLVGCV